MQGDGGLVGKHWVLGVFSDDDVCVCVCVCVCVYVHHTDTRTLHHLCIYIPLYTHTLLHKQQQQQQQQEQNHTQDVVCDVEDLGIPRVCTTTTCTTPHTHTPSSEIPTTTYVHNTCTWHQPASMGELRTLVRGLYDAGITFRVVGGGTGAGVYKNWIDERDSVIVEVTRVAEMRTVQCDEVGCVCCMFGCGWCLV